MTDKHKVFISYHHEGDQLYKNRFVDLFQHIMVDWSVRLGDIPHGLKTETVRQKIRDEWLRESTVTVVLIGAKTWQRKHVDWEISSSLRATTYNHRSGLLGVLLPSYRGPEPGYYDPRTIPPRLADNLGGDSPFAQVINWTDDAGEMQHWIHEAFLRRRTDPAPDNSRDLFRNNRSGESWS